MPNFGCGFLAYSWKLPAYSGAFLLTNDNFSFLLTVGAFLLTILAFLLTVGAFFAYSGKVRLIRALRDCKQISLTASKKTPTVSKKASPRIFYVCNVLVDDGNSCMWRQEEESGRQSKHRGT